LENAGKRGIVSTIGGYIRTASMKSGVTNTT
jgi:hypothetical protein